MGEYERHENVLAHERGKDSINPCSVAFLNCTSPTKKSVASVVKHNWLMILVVSCMHTKPHIFHGAHILPPKIIPHKINISICVFVYVGGAGGAGGWRESTRCCVHSTSHLYYSLIVVYLIVHSRQGAFKPLGFALWLNARLSSAIQINHSRL